MDRDTVIDILRANEAALRGLGVTHAAPFGSVARGDGHPGSDLDVMIETDEAVVRDLFAYVGVVQAIGDLFPIEVDVSNRAMLKERIRAKAEPDAVSAF